MIRSNAATFLQARRLRVTLAPAVELEAPVQITPAMVNRARAPRPEHLLRRAQAQGSMKAFLATARQLQRLPSFTGRRE